MKCIEHHVDFCDANLNTFSNIQRRGHLRRLLPAESSLRKQHKTTLTCTFSAVTQRNAINPYPTAFPYGNGMVLHFYQQQESSTTKTVHKVINRGLKAYV